MKEDCTKARRRRDLILLGLAGVAVLALYLPVLGAPFEYDDNVEILGNQVLRSPGSFWDIWGYNPFRVLLLYSFALDIQLFDFDPRGFRAVNIAIHLANVAALWTFLRRVAPRLLPDDAPSSRQIFLAAGTLIFAVHPLAIESVTYISGRSSSLATLFVLLALVQYARHADLRDDDAAAPLLTAWTRRNNLLLGAGAGALAAVGVPVGLMVQRGVLPPIKGLVWAIAGAGILCALLASLGSGRLVTAPPKVTANARERASAARTAWRLCFLFFVLGALTKEIAATLPVLLLLGEASIWTRGKGDARRALRGGLFLFFLVPALLLALRMATYGYIASPIRLRPVPQNLHTQAEVLLRYARLWVAPWPLSIYHDYPQAPPGGRAQSWTLALGWIGLATLLLSRLRRSPALAFGLLGVAATLAPTSIFPLKEALVEHRTYLPSVALCVALGWFFALLATRTSPRLSAGLLGLWLLGLGAVNVQYNTLWEDEAALWEHAVALNPDSSDAWRYLGDLHAGNGRFPQAIEAFEQAIQANVGNAEAHNKLGRLMAMRGELDQARLHFKLALDVSPCLSAAHNNLAYLKVKRKDWIGAVEQYNESLLCDDRENYLAHRGLGEIYFSEDSGLRNRKLAAEHYGKALEMLDPLSPDRALLKQRLMELSF